MSTGLKILTPGHYSRTLRGFRAAWERLRKNLARSASLHRLNAVAAFCFAEIIGDDAAT
jgi:hypothetical protein